MNKDVIDDAFSLIRRKVLRLTLDRDLARTTFEAIANGDMTELEQAKTVAKMALKRLSED